MPPYSVGTERNVQYEPSVDYVLFHAEVRWYRSKYGLFRCFARPLVRVFCFFPLAFSVWAKNL